MEKHVPDSCRVAIPKALVKAAKAREIGSWDAAELEPLGQKLTVEVPKVDRAKWRHPPRPLGR